LVIVGTTGKRVTVTVYVEVVVPSWAVTSIDIVFVPTESERDPEALPDVTEEYEPDPTFTWIVASAWFRVGVTVNELVPLATLTV